MEFKSFMLSRTPEIIFGPGKINELPQLIFRYGRNILLITGGSSLVKSGFLIKINKMLNREEIVNYHVTGRGEPSPDLVDEICQNYRSKNIDLVIAIGGGSVIDTGKAVSAILPQNDSVMEYLEGVGGGKTHNGKKTNFIAIPTTSGTGSEASKNAVLSRIGENGFKKSLRHNNFVPDIALLDPELTMSCPPIITAASGLDALTQLIEAYTSKNANLITDSLALEAIKYGAESLVPVSTDLSNNIDMRSAMAYASLISGIVLANAGLGIVHGLASPLGGFFDIPHGIVCGTLLGEAVKTNIELLTEQENGAVYLEKYARIGALITDNKYQISKNDTMNYCNKLINTLETWIDMLNIPRLGDYGVTEKDLDMIVEKTGNKNNPVNLNQKTIKKILQKRL